MPSPHFLMPFGRQAIAVATAAVLIVGCSSSSGGGSAPPPASAAAPSATAAAIASASASDSATGTAIDATESEFEIDLTSTTAPAGPVTFHIKNSGTTVHEFVVMRTDLAPDKLPVASGGPEVDEEGAGLTAVDEVEDIAAGSTADLTVDLTDGHYVIICNVPGHYQSGMKTEFIVGAAGGGKGTY